MHKSHFLHIISLPLFFLDPPQFPEGPSDGSPRVFTVEEGADLTVDLKYVSTTPTFVSYFKEIRYSFKFKLFQGPREPP